MGATFTYALEYHIAVTCVTPLRTGSTSGGIEDVLRSPDGAPFFQASSLAGALRQWLGKDSEQAQKLFGNTNRAGSLVLTDLHFAFRSENTHSTEITIRPRLHIDHATGTAANNYKFDVASLPVGTQGSFKLFWYGEKGEEQTARQYIEQMLSALHQGQIRLGAQKNNGFGKVSLSVLCHAYDMTNHTDRRCWLDRTERPGTIVPLPEIPPVALMRFVVTAKTDSILVKGAAARVKKDGSKTKAVNLMEGTTPIIPGSSIKGAVRSRVEAISKQLNILDDTVEKAFGRGNRGADNGIAGKIRFYDAQLEAQKETITRIRIDRLTGGVIAQGLFYEEPWGGSVKLEIDAPATGHDKACALMVYALRDLGLGLYNLGSGGAVGRGRLNVGSISITHPDWTATIRFDHGQAIVEDASGGLQRLMNTLKGGKASWK